MSHVIEVGYALGKCLIVVDASLADIPKLETSRFGDSFLVVFLFDEIEWKPNELERAILSLLKSGANAFLFHGKDAPKAESIADGLLVRTIRNETSENVILTASFTDVPLSEFLEEATLSIMPAGGYLEKWSSRVFFCPAGSKQAHRVAEMLR